MESENRKHLLLIYGLIVGVVFDIFFHDRTLGISYPMFISFLLIITALAFLREYGRLKNRAWMWSVPILILSLTFSLYSNQVLKIINFLIIPYLLIMMVSLVSDTNRAEWSDVRFIADFLKRVFVPFRYIHMPFTTFFRLQDKTGDRNKRILPRIAVGVLISIPVLALIIWLLSSADIVFKNLFIDIPVSKIIKHFFLILAVTVYSICFFWSLLKAFYETKSPVCEKINWKRFLDPVVIMTVISLLNIVFCVFSIIQFRYLFGGQSFLLPSEYTFAEYARRGFFELVAVSVINFLIILLAVTFIKRDNKKLLIAGRVLLSILVGFTFIMLASAFYRMLLYEQAYGFTYLRIFVQAFMVLLSFLFVINMIFIWYEKLPIIKAYFITSLAVYIALNFANVDVIIAGNNISRYQRTGQIDMEYLKGLSYDAVPEMAGLLEDSDLRKEVLDYFNTVESELENQGHWQSINLSRSKASRTVSRILR